MSSIFDLMKQSIGADEILKPDEQTTILGYCKAGTTGTNQASWCICKITEAIDGSQITIKWAEGLNDTLNGILVLDNYADYTYTYKIM
jgi:hypothetical protein